MTATACFKCHGKGEIQTGRIEGGTGTGFDTDGDISFMSMSDRRVFSSCRTCEGTGYLDENGKSTAKPAPPAPAAGTGVGMFGSLMMTMIILVMIILLLQRL
jgi:hypothetical protein